ncbi:phosphoenolpyruvate--protein phosphotransferase [Rariglobus hedericola]|uniref:phosphoenolpyruvate--protein phosphotransferase n=1 Tax=Rariglobus hedericola TaxID=2597822 RepID=A0A556QRE7_9BACT|nr:phosphoenolpyruvate--protein phosphotransferase [Rariglobus hedericola]TSJ79208.1 phosphoenolpyruvate--protein phosphotransferase [Rariglobus hedericola]
MTTTDTSSADLPLTLRTIRLGATVADKAAAIRAAGQLLVDAGYIEPGYIDSMLAREGQANTCLGHGIAIPHGQQKDRTLIKQTGLAVLQIPEGVRWNDTQIVHVVIGIAARGDEHLEILAALTDVLDDDAAAQRLATTTHANDILAALRRGSPSAKPAAAAVEPWAGAVSVDVVLQGHAGLHARPATKFAETAADFSSEIRVIHGDRAANGKAMASLLRLGVESGSTLRIEARGSDADAALAVLREAVESGLGDADELAEATSPVQAWTPPETVTAVIIGTSAAPGMAIAPIFRFRAEMLSVEDTRGEPAAERRRLDKVIAEANAELERLGADAEACPVAAEAEIFKAHQALIADADLHADVVALIEEGHSAPWSWQQVIERRVDEVRRLKNERLAGRAADLRDIGQRVLRLFSGVVSRDPVLPSGKCILVADDLTPSDTARLDPKKILGICTAAGGPTSHTAIIARARGLPAVVGAGSEVLSLADGTLAILDGGAGRLYPHPEEFAVASAKQFQAELAHHQAAADADRFRPAFTTDGHRVEIVANIGHAEEAAAAVEAGAEGVGLLRTEFLFLGRETAPTEEEQFLAYTEMIRALNGLPLIIRTLDIGGDKIVPYLGLAHEENPFLGVRGIRLCLRRPDVFKTQLRAIYRAAATAEAGAVKIMFPMVTTLEDLRSAKKLAEAVRAEIGGPACELGIMVEVPSVVLMAREFAREADFFSVGTNDLTQYALAIDRQHPELGKEADALHPAVLRLIDLTVKAATAEGKWVGVCGGAAGEPLGASILTGLGVAELSMSAPSLAAVKAKLRGTSLKALRALAQRALACSTAAEVRALSK